MRILSVDSTAQTASVGVIEERKISALYTIEAQTHSVTLMPMIESILRFLNFKITDMDLLAVSNGPGSFTGIRIGVATVKGMAFRDNIPCVGVSSLEAMAYNLTGMEGIVCPVINARRNQVYSALFQSNDGRIIRLTDDTIVPLDGIDDILKSYRVPVYFTGDAAEMAYSALCYPQKALPPSAIRRPNAYGVALLAEKIYLSSENASDFTEQNLKPSYLRKSQPEREREEREKRENLSSAEI